MSRITPMFFVHFSPLEGYPPAMNAINCFAATEDLPEMYVFTTASSGNVQTYQPPVKKNNIRIIRMGGLPLQAGLLKRLWVYGWFNSVVLLYLFFFRPLTVLYFETISSFSAVVYKQFIRRSCRLFIHYHEYMTTNEYANGMKLVRWYHEREKKIYPLAAWVSHTNQQRMDLFVKDIYPVVVGHQQILPNYPPASWQHITIPQDVNSPGVTRVVYVGSLSLHTMYLAAFAEWVQQQQGKVTWDIYSLNIEPSARDYLLQLKSPWIHIKAGVFYYDLPTILPHYQAGVILYKGHIPNWVYNVPNKLFEYHVCGLDVWFPEQMVTSLQYKSKGTYPKIIPINFDNSNGMDLTTLLNRDGLHYKLYAFSSEVALHLLGSALQE